jgi:hypothetical protein
MNERIHHPQAGHKHAYSYMRRIVQRKLYLVNTAVAVFVPQSSATQQTLEGIQAQQHK